MLPSDLRIVSYVLAQLRAHPWPEDTELELVFHKGWLEALQRVEDTLSVPYEPAKNPDRVRM